MESMGHGPWAKVLAGVVDLGRDLNGYVLCDCRVLGFFEAR